MFELVEGVGRKRSDVNAVEQTALLPSTLLLVMVEQKQFVN